MKIKITSCENAEKWYSKMIGQEVDVDRIDSSGNAIKDISTGKRIVSFGDFTVSIKVESWPTNEEIPSVHMGEMALLKALCLGYWFDASVFQSHYAVRAREEINVKIPKKYCRLDEAPPVASVDFEEPEIPEVPIPKSWVKEMQIEEKIRIRIFDVVSGPGCKDLAGMEFDTVGPADNSKRQVIIHPITKNAVYVQPGDYMIVNHNKEKGNPTETKESVLDALRKAFDGVFTADSLDNISKTGKIKHIIEHHTIGKNGMPSDIQKAFSDMHMQNAEDLKKVKENVDKIKWDLFGLPDHKPFNFKTPLNAILRADGEFKGYTIGVDPSTGNDESVIITGRFVNGILIASDIIRTPKPKDAIHFKTSQADYPRASFRGAWAPGIYYPGDLVELNGAFYTLNSKFSLESKKRPDDLKNMWQIFGQFQTNNEAYLKHLKKRKSHLARLKMRFEAAGFVFPEYIEKQIDYIDSLIGFKNISYGR